MYEEKKGDSCFKWFISESQARTSSQGIIVIFIDVNTPFIHKR